MPTFDFYLGRTRADALAVLPVLRITEEVHQAAFADPALRGRSGGAFSAMRDFYRRSTEIDSQEASELLSELQAISAIRPASENLQMFVGAVRLLVEKAIRDDLVIVFAGP